MGSQVSALITYSSPYLHKLGTLSESQQTTATALIAAASASIERFCRRSFALASHDETQAVGELGWAWLDHFPVVTVDEVFTERTSLLTVQNTTATHATVSSTATGLRLTRVNAGVVATPSTVAFADAVSIEALATAITALGNGWAASAVDYYRYYPSSQICIGQFSACSEAVSLIGWVSQGGGGILQVDYESGMVSSCSPEIRVRYTAGFSTIPEDIQQVCANLVVHAFDAAESGALQSEDLGDYAYTLATDAIDSLPIRDRQILSMYRNRRP